MRVPLPLPACGDNFDDIPAFLRVENREPLAPEQQAALDKAMAVASASQKMRDDLRAVQREAREIQDQDREADRQKEWRHDSDASDRQGGDRPDQGREYSRGAGVHATKPRKS